MKRKKLLAIRFSAMGDVAMASIVAKAAMDSDEDLELDFLAKPFFEPLFEKMPGFRFLKPDLKLRHRGIIGLYKLYRDLKTNKYHAVADLHGSLRSRILGFFFRMGGTPVYTIDKGRSEKRRLIREGAHKTGALKHSVDRFADVFQRAGVKANTEKLPLPSLGTATSRVEALLKKKGGQKWIGIAPFAAHTSKEWDFEKMKALAEELRNIGCQILWFGAGKREIGILEEKLMREESDILIAGHFKLQEELALMRHLDAMVCMDSANMHMGAMSGIPVVSIWGPTHPFAGFAPVHNEAGIVQAHLPCRPCTIYGKIRSKSGEECARRSMEMVTVEMVLERVLKSLAF